MKIINTIGGLGNQMFCYAFALALKNKYNEEVLLDISHFNHYNLHNGFQINDIFKNDLIKIASKKEISKLTSYIPHYKLSRILRKLLPIKSKEYIESRDYIYDGEAMNVAGDCYYEGYWQSPHYFKNIESDVKRIFTFPTTEGDNKKLENIILDTNSISIHIRRGDYLNAKSFKGICELDYYREAIALMNSKVDNPYYFIFSNDINWCVENLTEILNTDRVKFVSHNVGKESYWDMYLMSCCKNMVIANSSFSWWAAYLNRSVSPIIVAPKRWVNRNYNTQILIDKWLLI